MKNRMQKAQKFVCSKQIVFKYEIIVCTHELKILKSYVEKIVCRKSYVEKIVCIYFENSCVVNFEIRMQEKSCVDIQKIACKE